MSLSSLFRKRQRRACRLKERIYSEKRARKIAESMTKREGVPCESYKCEICGAWHVGHSSLLANTVRGSKAKAEAERKGRTA